MQVPYAQESRLEALVSRKGGNCEVTSEESETTKLGTDEQKPYTEAYLLGVSKHIIVTPKEDQKGNYVDTAVIE